MKKYILLALLFFSTLEMNLFAQTWTEQTSGLTTTLYSVSAVNDDIAWICGATGKVLKTTNKGVNWINVSSNLSSSYEMYNVFAWDANIALVTGNSGGIGGTTAIFRTANGGTNWITVNSHSGFGDNLWMTSANNAYFIGEAISGYWDLLSSTNGGINWSIWSILSGSSNAGSNNNAAWFQGQQVWFGTVPIYKIMYSSDMGANWSAQTISLWGINSICFNTTTKGMAGGTYSSSGLLFTTNAGINWAPITSPYPSNAIVGICGTQSTWWVAQGGIAGARGISISTNDGLSWTTAYTAPDGTNKHMAKSRSGHTIWVVRSNGGISRYGTFVGINPNSNEIPSSYSLSQNYPNPFNPITRINFTIPKQGLVNLGIYDILGREVKTLVKEVKTPGSYSVDFNGTNMSSGVYFYRMESNGYLEIKKMILIK